MGLILDTSFVVALQREGSRRIAGPANAFLAARMEESFAITFTVAGELACGRSASDLGYWKQLCRPFIILPWSIDVAWEYGEIYRKLQSRGMLIGANDMWIAATALVHGSGVVTGNLREFQRVPNLDVIGF